MSQSDDLMEPYSSIRQLFQNSPEGEPLPFCLTKDEAFERAHKILSEHPKKVVRVVGSWRWLDLDVEESELTRYEEIGVIPAVLFATQLFHDFNGRMSPGGWVCSSTLVEGSQPGPVLTTRNSCYVLAGSGRRHLAAPTAIETIYNRGI